MIKLGIKIFAMFLLFASISQAQVKVIGELGLKYGGAISSTSYGNGESEMSKRILTPSFALGIEKEWNQKWSSPLYLEYSQIGFQDSYHERAIVDYLGLVGGVKRKFGKFFLSAETGFNLKLAENSSNFNGYSGFPPNKRDFEIPLKLKLGYQLSPRISINANFHHSLLPFYKYQFNNDTQLSKSYRGFGIRIAYRF